MCEKKTKGKNFESINLFNLNEFFLCYCRINYKIGSKKKFEKEIINIAFVTKVKEINEIQKKKRKSTYILCILKRDEFK